jgi:hypothetical protein
MFLTRICACSCLRGFFMLLNRSGPYSGDGSFHRAKAVNWRKHYSSFWACEVFSSLYFLRVSVSDRAIPLAYRFLKVTHQQRIMDLLFGRLGQITGPRQALLAKRPYFVFWVSVHEYVGRAGTGVLGRFLERR